MAATIPALIEGFARLAVEEYNTKKGLALKFQNILKWEANGEAVQVSKCEITLMAFKGPENKKCVAVVRVSTNNTMDLEDFKIDGYA